MIKNLIKRQELAQMVYNRYGDNQEGCNLTKVEKKELEHHVGVAFDAYELAPKEITTLITDGKTAEDIMQFITEVTGA